MFMRDVFVRVMVLCSVLLLAACQGLPGKVTETFDGTKAPDTPAPPVALPFTEPVKAQTELDTEVVYNALLGEIASQRGDMELAYESHLQAARLSGDAKSAERATRIGMYLKDNLQALEAVQLWVELAPNELTARQLAAMLSLEQGDDEAVFGHLKAVVSISQVKGSDGFMHAITALSRSQESDRVIALMRRLAAEYPGQPEAEYAVALAASIVKRLDVAEQEALQLIENHPDLEKGYILLSRVHVSNGDKPAARQVLEQAVNAYPNSALLHSAYGRLLIDLQEVEPAYQQFLALRELSPNQPEVHLSLGVLALQLEKLGESRGHLLKNLELDPKSNEAAYYLGRIDEIEENHAAAINWYRQVSAGDLSYEAQVRMANLQADGGSLAEARDSLRGLRIRFANHSIELYLVEAEMLKKHAKPEDVSAVYNQGLAAHPGDTDLLYARALYAVTQDRLDILEQDLRVILDKDPEHADALNALGYTLTDRTERHQEALGLIQRALALKPDAPAILDSMGWVQYRLGNHAEALGYLQRAIELMPDSEIAAHLGAVLWVTGDREQARKVWNDALESDPENQYLRDTMQQLTE